MADIVNLRTARKRKQRAEKLAKADENRAKSSIPGRTRKALKANRENDLKRLDGHLLDRSSRRPGND